MAKAKVQPKPLEQLEAALSKTSNSELLAFGVAILEEGAARAGNYRDAIGEASDDTLNEGVAFVAHLDDLYFAVTSNHPRIKDARWKVANCKDALENASWNEFVEQDDGA